MGEIQINVADIHIGTHALGPGLRSVVWFQGCPLRCKGCYSPAWIPETPQRWAQPEELARELTSNPAVEGVTISGGEPFHQPEGLRALLAALYQLNPSLTVIVYSGFRLEQLRERVPELDAILARIDVLIDGPYLNKLNDNRGLRGSSNQRVHFLSERLKGADFETGPRHSELHFQDGAARWVGVPDRVITQNIQAMEALAGGEHVWP